PADITPAATISGSAPPRLATAPGTSPAAMCRSIKSRNALVIRRLPITGPLRSADDRTEPHRHCRPPGGLVRVRVAARRSLTGMVPVAILRHVPKYQEELDRMFHALGDATRRSVVERLARGPASVSELARPFDMALPSVVQHLGVLEAAGIVESTKVGRVR